MSNTNEIVILLFIASITVMILPNIFIIFIMTLLLHESDVGDKLIHMVHMFLDKYKYTYNPDSPFVLDVLDYLNPENTPLKKAE